MHESEIVCLVVGLAAIAIIMCSRGNMSTYYAPPTECSARKSDVVSARVGTAMPVEEEEDMDGLFKSTEELIGEVEDIAQDISTRPTKTPKEIKELEREVQPKVMELANLGKSVGATVLSAGVTPHVVEYSEQDTVRALGGFHIPSTFKPRDVH